jgi:hypothetical protein
MHDDRHVVPAHWSRAPVVWSIWPHPAGAGPPQVWKLPPLSMQLTQHRHLLSAAQAETSEQQLALVHVTQAVSPVAGAQAPPELELELTEDDVVVATPLQGALQLLVMQALSAPVVPSTPLHWALHRLSLPGCCARQPIQHVQLVSPRQAWVSLQHAPFVHVVHAVSPGAGLHTPPEVDVLEVLDTVDVLDAIPEDVVDTVPVVVAPPEPVVLVVPDAVTVGPAPDPPDPLTKLVAVLLPVAPPLPKDTEPPPPQPAPSAAPPSSSEPTIHPSVSFRIRASGRDAGPRRPSPAHRKPRPAGAVYSQAGWSGPAWRSSRLIGRRPGG